MVLFLWNGLHDTTVLGDNITAFKKTCSDRLLQIHVLAQLATSVKVLRLCEREHVNRGSLPDGG